VGGSDRRVALGAQLLALLCELGLALGVVLGKGREARLSFRGFALGTGDGPIVVTIYTN
jgi:hypothetical protein